MSKNKKLRIAVIGAGFGGMSAAAYLADAGFEVTVFEKNRRPGGRAQVINTKGFTFDMGPSWYMMPDVFEEFFSDFGKQPTDFFSLKKLDPAYQVITNKDSFKVRSYPAVRKLFKDRDPSSVKKFEKFFAKSKKDYQMVRQKVLNKPMLGYKDVVDPAVLKMLLSSNTAMSYRQRIGRVTKDEDLRHMLEFMAVFMGGRPENIPAIYSLLNYADMGLGVSYPMGGFSELARAFESVAKGAGVNFKYGQEVTRIETNASLATSVMVGRKKYPIDGVVANADYQFVEMNLLSSVDRAYSAEYWQSKTMSPSALLIFLGVKARVPKLLHHNLFFDTDWDKHFDDIFKNRQWPHEPLFYVSVPSKSDASVAPKSHENIFVLVPIAGGRQPSDKKIKSTVNNVIERLEGHTNFSIRNKLVVKKWRAQKYFEETFNAYRGNAFGLSHTLSQSAVFRPRIESKRVKNLWYCGQYTNPGTGVPMVVLSGKVASKRIIERANE